MPLLRGFSILTTIILIAIAAKPMAAAEDGACPSDSGKYFDRAQGECVACPLPSPDEQAQLHYSVVCRDHRVCCVPDVNSTQKSAVTLEVATKSPMSLTSATGTSSSTPSSGSDRTAFTPPEEVSTIPIYPVVLAVIVVVVVVVGVGISVVVCILCRQQSRRIIHIEDGQTAETTASASASANKLAAGQCIVSCTAPSSTEERAPLVPATLSHGSSPGMRSLHRPNTGSSNQSDHTGLHQDVLSVGEDGPSEGGSEDRPLPSLPSDQGHGTVGGLHETSTVFNELLYSGTAPRESAYPDNTTTMDSGTYETTN